MADTSRELLAEYRTGSWWTDHDLSASATNVQDQQWPARQAWIGRDPAKGQIRFLIAGKDLHRKPGGLLYSVGQRPLVLGFAHRARGHDAEDLYPVLGGLLLVILNHPAGVVDGRVQHMVTGVESSAQTRLLPAFQQGKDFVALDIGHQQFHRIGANIDDRSS